MPRRNPILSERAAKTLKALTRFKNIIPTPYSRYIWNKLSYRIDLSSGVYTECARSKRKYNLIVSAKDYKSVVCRSRY